MTSILDPTSLGIQAQSPDGQGLLIVGQFAVPNFIKIDGVGSDTIMSGSKGDIINAAGGDDMISSQTGNDIVDGGAGNDVIKAGGGGDIVIGGKGADLMTGGLGDDTFVIDDSDLDGSLDTITDFALGEDAIKFSGIGSGAQIQYDAATGIISIDGQDVLKLDSGLGIDSDNIKNVGGSDWEIF
jgi:Ca2+-binding RTX toxin-like protein